MIPNC